MRKVSLSLVALVASAIPAMTFVHPGAMSTKVELEFIKEKIKLGAEPWSSAYKNMKNIEIKGKYTKTTAPQDQGKLNEDVQKADAKLAYANALKWYFEGDTVAANQAALVFRVWANTFNGYQNSTVLSGDGATGGTNQSSLDCAWIGAIFGPAAEILREYPGWSAADQAATKDLFKTKFYPDLNIMNYWNGNEDLTQIDAMMSMAVFLDDSAELAAGLKRLKGRGTAYFYLTTDPPSTLNYGTRTKADWYGPTKWVDGLTQETCRDNDHHAQFALASLFHAAEVAWHQGVDVYTPNQTRYVAALELMGLQLASGDMQGTCGGSATTEFFSTLEVGYNHYHNRMKLDLPNTLKAITEKIRPKGGSDWNIFYETLTHAELPYTAGVADRKLGSGKVGLQVGVQGNQICNLQSDKTEKVGVSVMTLNGKQVSQTLVSLVAGQSRSFSLGLEAAPSGLYLVQVRSSEGTVAVKISK